MKTSEQGQDFIKSFEKLRLTAYLDDVGVPTIYYGHTLGVKMGMSGTKEDADRVFGEDIAEFEGYVDQLVTVPLNQHQYDALVSFAFNVGPDIDADTIPEGLGDSTLLKLLNQGDYTGAAKQFESWDKGLVHGVLQRLPGLTTRRKAERKIFETGVYEMHQ